MDDGVGGKARGALRKSVRMQARIRERGTPFDLDVVDLSPTGFRGETVYNLPIGSRIFATLPGLAPLEAKVMWRDAVFVGCAFATPLHPAVFDHIVARSGS